MKTKRYYRLGIQPLMPILSGLIFDNRKDATQRAREENRIGEYRGRGVTVFPCNAAGRIVFKD